MRFRTKWNHETDSGWPSRKENTEILLEDGTRLDVQSFVSDYDEAFFGNDGISRLHLAHEQAHSRLPGSASVRLGPPFVQNHLYRSQLPSIGHVAYGQWSSASVWFRQRDDL
jgi:hypothetical protein